MANRSWLVADCVLNLRGRSSTCNKLALSRHLIKAVQRALEESAVATVAVN